MKPIARKLKHSCRKVIRNKWHYVSLRLANYIPSSIKYHENGYKDELALYINLVNQHEINR